MLASALKPVLGFVRQAVHAAWHHVRPLPAVGVEAWLLKSWRVELTLESRTLCLQHHTPTAGCLLLQFAPALGQLLLQRVRKSFHEWC
jgi:hypothetical protein